MGAKMFMVFGSQPFHSGEHPAEMHTHVYQKSTQGCREWHSFAGGWAKEGGKSEATSAPSVEPNTGLDLTTLRS